MDGTSSEHHQPGLILILKKEHCYHRQKENPSKGVTPSDNAQLKVA